MSAATGVNPGRNVVGLQPDDRAPSDYLRMVARVFAAYRLTPLEKSVVAYIDGFHLSIESFVEPEAIIGITDGQGFCDDQFIGYCDGTSPESTLTVDVHQMTVNVIYSIVLCYTWVNVMPPRKPNFDLVEQINIDEEHHLELGQLIWDGTNLELIDDKRMWMWDLLDQFIGDTEIDGPGDPASKELPFLVAIKENESLDIGWALDFHEEAGADAPANPHNYDVRLSSYSVNNTQTSGEVPNTNKLYINGGAILSAPAGDTALADPQDSGLPGFGDDDSYGAFHSNMRIVDSSDTYSGFKSDASNNGYVNYELGTYHPGLVHPDGHWPTEVDNPHGAKLSHWHAEHETHLINYYNFDCPSCIINDFKLGSQPFDLTINNEQILSYYDFPGGVPPELVFFIGKFPLPPGERFPNIPAKSGIALEDGDMYYNTSVHAYYFWEVNRWSMVGSGTPVRGSTYNYTATTDQVNFPSALGAEKFACDPHYTIVTRAGLALTRDGFDTTGTWVVSDYDVLMDSTGSYITQIQMHQPCEDLEKININTINVGPGLLPDLEASTLIYYNGSSVATGGQTEFQLTSNVDWDMVYRNGKLLLGDTIGTTVPEYDNTGLLITLANPLVNGDILQLITVDESTGIRLDFMENSFKIAAINQVLTLTYNADFVIVYKDGLMLVDSKYDATVPGQITLTDPVVADEIYQVYSIGDKLGEFSFGQGEIIATAGQSVFNFACLLNPAFTIVSLDGNVLRSGIEYTLDNGNINIVNSGSVSAGNIVKLYSMQDNVLVEACPVVVTAPGCPPATPQLRSYEDVGNGVETVFTIVDFYFTTAVVSINGSRQQPTIAYNITNVGADTVVTFTAAPAIGDWIIIDYFA